jgi:quercetin dioxygenase-like cupin family protein
MRRGDAAWNPVSGEKVLVVESAEETAGRRLVLDLGVEPGGFLPGGEHVHDHLTERFHVERGHLAFASAGERRLLGPGDELSVAPGAWHTWDHAGAEEVRLRVTIEPALDVEEAVLVAWGLSADGHANRKGLPSPLLAALLARRYRHIVRYRRPPQLLQRLLLPPLAAVARRRGLDRTLDRYLDLDAHPCAQPGLGALPERVLVTRRL